MMTTWQWWSSRKCAGSLIPDGRSGGTCAWWGLWGLACTRFAVRCDGGGVWPVVYLGSVERRSGWAAWM